MDVNIRKSATISKCQQYRYQLDREWFPDDRINSPARITYYAPMIFVMLNPSTADAYEDDPTIRRCLGFARREGYRWLKVINLFAGRATKPADLFKMDDPIGPENRSAWDKAFNHVEWGAKIVCGWGADKSAKAQASRFLEQAGDTPLHCLGTSKDGSPRHPLYLKSDAPLVQINPAHRPTLSAHTTERRA